MDLAGRWKTLFVCIVIAAAGLTYLASFKLPVVAAMEQAVITVSDQLPSLVNDMVGTIMTGAGEQGDTTAKAEPSITESDTVPDTPSSQTASQQEEAPVAQEAAMDVSTSDSGVPLPTSTEPTGTLDSIDPDLVVSEPVTLLSENQLADFMSTRVGLVPSGTTNFPAHDVNITGEFVFKTPSIYGSHFSATKHRPIPESAQVPTYYSALTSYNDGTMNGFELYKNMTHGTYYGNCYIAMSAGEPVSFNGLSIEVTELYGQQLTGLRTFLIPELWTTNPGEDLPLGPGEIPPAPNDPFSGNNFKVTVIKMTASYIQMSNFVLSVREGTFNSN